MENNELMTDYDSIMIGDKSLDEWANMYSPEQGTSITPEKAMELGVLRAENTPEPPVTVDNTTGENNGATRGWGEEKEYKKLSPADTLKDIGAATGAEALRIFAPKEGSKASEFLGYSEEDLYQYEAQTRIGEGAKYFYRYGMGTLAFIFGGGKVGAAIKGIGAVAKSTGLVKLGAGIQKLFTGDTFIKTGANAGKLAKAGAFTVNNSISGMAGGAMADFFLYDEEGGRMADSFGVTNNPLITYLQTNENESEFEARFKNVVEGIIVGIPFGLGVGAVQSISRYVRSMHKAARAQTEEEAINAIGSAMMDEQNLKQVLSAEELRDTVKQLKIKADNTGEDAEQLILDNLSNAQYEDAKTMLKIYNQGDDVFVHPDGTWDISVQKWQDASKVSPEEFRKQLSVRDEADDTMREGDIALEFMNETVRDTWLNRGWIGSQEDLTSKNANKIIKNYKDKWKIDNNIKVEFVDGLTIKGAPVEGNTQVTQYLGKKGSDNTKLSNILIQIDKNAANPYATLRSELEHARDAAKGSIPDMNVQHFSRYQGMNEAEAAPEYIYGKAQRRASQPAEEIPSVETPVKEEVEQLKLDFSSSEDISQNFAQGSLKPSTLQDMDNIITKGVELDTEISGTDFKALAQDADNIPDNIKEYLKLEDPSTIRAFFNETDETAAILTRKQLFASKIISQTLDRIKELGSNPAQEAKRNLIDTLEWLKQYKQQIGSGLGRGLNEQKFINKAMDTFGSVRFTELNKAGINSFIDLLSQTIKTLDLNFTRGAVRDNKQKIIEALQQSNPSVFSAIFNSDNKTLRTSFDNIITELASKGTNADLEALGRELADAFTDIEYDAVLDAANKAPSKEGMWQTIKKWTNAKGGLASYYIHNLFSPSSLIKNVVSGGMNTLYFPLKKMFVKIDPWVTDTAMKERLYREGARTYSNLVASWSEAWELCKEAFISGEGRMSNFGTDTLNLDEDTFRGFYNWNDLGHIFENIHSFITRAMGASDELLTQLNYRAIARSRATEITDRIINTAGREGDERYWQDTFNNVFNTFFEETTGKPTKIDIFYEAKRMLYQTPLSGKMQDNNGRIFDVRTGKELMPSQKASQTLAMTLGEALQKHANRNLLIKAYIPFIKTGINILQENLDHNILYLGLSKTQRDILVSPTKEGALMRAQAAFGAFSFLLGSTLALGGVITGSMPADAKERKALLATGWRPYSIKAGNQYISYQGYEPLHTMLGFSCDMTNLVLSAVTKEDEDKALKYFIEAGRIYMNNFLDKAAFRTSLQSFNALMELDESNIPNLKKSLSQPISGMLPAGGTIRNLSTLGERDVKSPQGITERIFNNYFNRGLGEYKRNAFGEKQTITSFILSTATQQGKDYPEDIELNRLAAMGYKPSEISEKIAGYNINYRDFRDESTGQTAYDLMMEELSQSDIRQEVRQLVTSDYYQQLDDGVDNAISRQLGVKYSSADETKVNYLNDIFIEYNDRIKEEIVDKYPNLYNSEGVSLQEMVDRANTAKEMQENGARMDRNMAEKLNSLF